MILESISGEAERIKEAIPGIGRQIEGRASDACEAIRGEANHFLSEAGKSIRRNPLPSVAGAAVLGMAVGCMIMSGRHSRSFDGKYLKAPLADAGNAISKTLRHLHGNLKFW